jgi:hypothetical protein
MADKKKTPLEMLREFFTEAQMARLARSPGRTIAREPTAKTKERRKAVKMRWNSARSERHAKIVCCNACHGWFRSFAERYEHVCTKKAA